MAGWLRKNAMAGALVAGHLLAAAGVLHFVVEWDVRPAPTLPGRTVSAAGLLAVVGSDIGLLGLWLGCSSAAWAMRWFVTLTCAACSCLIYSPDLYEMVRDREFYIESPWQYYALSKCAAIAGIHAMPIVLLWLSLSAVKCRGVRLKQLAAEEIRHKASHDQFNLMHLLLLAAVASLMLGFSINCRDWFGGHINLRRGYPAYTPGQSAETVLFSVLCLVAETLVVAWATLGYGRVWFKVLVALSLACLFGCDWALAFTGRQRQHFLLANALFASCVALAQAIVMTGMLLLARRRGYRFIHDADNDAGNP